MNIAFVDDNNIQLKSISLLLKNTLDKNFTNYSLITFSSSSEFLKYFYDKSFDVVFLDIDMPDVDGFEIAKLIRKQNSKVYIIFITNHSELVYKSFDFQPFHFICKNNTSIMQNSIQEVVNKLAEHIKQNKRIEIEITNSDYADLKYSDIAYIDSDNHYINFHINHIPYIFKRRETIKNVENEFSKYDFVKIHRSIIVNMAYVRRIDTVSNTTIISYKEKELIFPISKSFKANVMETYKLYLRKIT